MSRAASKARNQKTFRWVVLGLVGLFLAYPLYALFEFSIRFPLTGKYSWDAWARLFGAGDGARLGPLYVGLQNSLVIALLTLTIMFVLLLPTMVWVRLRLPGLTRIVEFIVLLPLTLPAIVLVVGLVPVYRFIATKVLDTHAIWLAFAYVILVLPFSYRALDSGLSAIDVKTLTAAARSMGASWPTVLFRVILPNLSNAVASAAFISIAVVLGEFTIARMLARENLQTGVMLVNQAAPQVAAAVSLLTLLFGIALLVGLSYITSRQRKKKVRS
ncbi:MAG: ABC transporter permease subunit [Propionibacteriaceae bacterium]|nr:ABC transporter permease subunit [Propionibacteriaceae bacterium]